MADQTAKDEAIKARIIKHMNADHADSLSLYLRHFSKLSSSAARNPTLLDITLEEMTVRTEGGKVYIIPLEPAMKTFTEARERSVSMDQEARSALGVAAKDGGSQEEVKITEYIPPTSPFQIFVFSACVFTICIFTFSSHIVPGTLFYDKFLPWFPGGPKWFLGIQRAIALPVVGIHVAETWWLDRSRLQKYGVKRGSGLWWKWALSCLCEGYGTFARIDKRVRREERERKAH